MDKIQDLDELRATLESSGNVLSLPMWMVRNAYGAERLGVVVRQNLTKQLRGLGIGHVPVELPLDAGRFVRLYRLGSPEADVIEAVLNPDDMNDQRIKSAAGGHSARLIDQIRELVCD